MIILKKYKLGENIFNFKRIQFDYDLSSYFKKVIEKYFDKLNENIENAFQKLSDANVNYSAFLDYDIPPHHFMMYADIHYILSARENDNSLEKTEEVNSYFEKVFDERIKNRIINNWKNNSLLTIRLELLMQAIECYENELYGPAVSTFATQIEGVMKQKIDKPFENIGTKKLKHIINKLFSKKGIGSTDLTTSKYFEDKFIKSNRDLPSNRHAIAHGNIANYTKKIDAVRMIMIFDSVVSRLDVADKKALLGD